MPVKLIGAILVVAGCGGFGFMMALQIKREIGALRRLISALDFMCCELEYRVTPLPELCRNVSTQYTGSIGTVFRFLAEELEGQVAPDAAFCMESAIKRTPELPKRTSSVLTSMGRTLGLFDLSGQIKGLRGLQEECGYYLEELERDKTQRLRSYQTLGLCAGAALAILFI
jgi:stage III sporulation protein AB